MKNSITPFVVPLVSLAFVGGVQFTKATADRQPVPVECQEDEVLYFEDYEGPGENSLGELICLHMEDVTAPLVQCVPGEMWYSTSYADDVVKPSELECVDPHSMP